MQLGDLTVLPRVRYVITLDSDTQLPPGAAVRMIGAMAHPLNRPRFDPAVRRVREGYGVLQPRVDISLRSASRTLFARTMAGHVGLDPWTTATSDVDQDLFHEGSDVGKGIYDVDAFNAALGGRVRENTLLSHDLFEGFFARAGLATDIHLVDDFPTHYLAWAGRLHRWVRGDWQLVRWLLPRVSDAEGRHRNPLPALARWKVLDNLRRSLLSPSLVALLVLGWTLLPGSAWTWSLLALLVLAYPAYLGLGESLGQRIRGVSLWQHLQRERLNLLVSGRQALLTTVFLLDQARLMLDAIARDALATARDPRAAPARNWPPCGHPHPHGRPVCVQTPGRQPDRRRRHCGPRDGGPRAAAGRAADPDLLGAGAGGRGTRPASPTGGRWNGWRIATGRGCDRSAG